jgi:hypothetical protein
VRPRCPSCRVHRPRSDFDTRLGVCAECVVAGEVHLWLRDLRAVDMPLMVPGVPREGGIPRRGAPALIDIRTSEGTGGQRVLSSERTPRTT